MMQLSTASVRQRILFFNDTPRNGGPGKVLLHFLRHIDRAQFFCAVHLMRPDVLSEIYLAERVTDELSFDANLVENPIQPLNRAMERRDFNAPVWLKGVRVAANASRAIYGVCALATRMRVGNYDLLYCNGLYAIIVGGLLARFASVQVIWHLHDTSFPKALFGAIKWMARSKNVRSIIAVSEAAARTVCFAREKTFVAHNPIDLCEFERSKIISSLRQELGWSEDAVIFGGHGRIIASKGFQTMIRAARIALDKASPELRRKMCFVVIGDTPVDHPTDHLAECRALAQELNIAGQFIFVGYRKDVCPYVADYNVCVVPSSFAEPFGLSVVEGFAFGVPVIASAVGGIPEIVQSGTTGLLVPPDDPEALALAMLTYAQNPELRQRHGEAGRAYVEQHHDARTYAITMQNNIRQTRNLDMAPLPA